MRPIERKIEKEPNEEKKQVLTEHAQAIRATLTFKRKSDWGQGGVRAVELCQNIHESLVETAATYSNPLIEAMQDLTSRFKGELENKASQIKARQQEIQAVHTIFIEPNNINKMFPEEHSQLKSERIEDLAIA